MRTILSDDTGNFKTNAIVFVRKLNERSHMVGDLCPRCLCVYSPCGARDTQVVRCIQERQDQVIFTLPLRMCVIGIFIIHDLELGSLLLSRLREGVSIALLFVLAPFKFRHFLLGRGNMSGITFFVHISTRREVLLRSE